MKEIPLFVLAWVLCLGAVEWDYEQVVDESGSHAQLSILTLDKNETPHILYYFGDPGEEASYLKYASQSGEDWVINPVVQISKNKPVSFSFDFLPSNDVMIAYSYVGNMGNTDIYLACDSLAIFEILNLTDDSLSQWDPLVRVGSDGIVRIVYREQNDDGYNIRYGWLDSEGFHSESIKDSMSTHLRGYDFVLDGENVPSVFFYDDDLSLWFAQKTQSGKWLYESLEINGDAPSVSMDSYGSFHIACQTYSDIGYLTNESGSWQTELIENTTVDQNWLDPSLALDPQGTSHVMWWSITAPYLSLAWTYEVWYTTKQGSSWTAPDSMPPNEFKQFGGDNPFHIDSKGYGHVCYTINEEVYYVKSSESLSIGVAENEPCLLQNTLLKVIGETVSLSLDEASEVSADLYDATGSWVENLASGFYSAGEHVIPLNTNGLSGGVYFVRVEALGHAASAKFVKTK